MLKKAERYGVILIISILFLVIYSYSTSPLTSYYGYDSAFFWLVGRGMTEGLLPYRDFFDMKGPYLFFIEYIGQIICEGRSGAFCIQIINLTCSLYIIDKIYRIHKTKSDGMSFKDVIALLPCLYVASYTFEGGNLTEEFSLPLLLLGLYFAITYFENDEVRHPYRFGFFYGMVFGILSLIRITNASLIGAIILTISIELVVNKEFENLFLNGISFIAGGIIALLPAVIFFAREGLLIDMMNQVFLFGVRYSTEIGFFEKLVYIWQDQKACLVLMSLMKW